MHTKQVNDTHTLTGSKRNLGRDLIIGMSDGLVVPFALMAGLTGAMDQSESIIQTTCMATAACAVLMGIGGYHAGKSELDEGSHRLQKKEERIKAFYANLDISPELQQIAVQEKIREDEAWTNMIDCYALSEEPASRFQYTKTGIRIGLSYLLSGLLPLIPYFFLNPSLKALPYSIAIALATLFALGYMKGKGSGEPAWWSACTAVIMGALAAGGAFFVGRLFA